MSARGSKVRHHVYVEDKTAGADQSKHRPCTCGLPYRHSAHHLPEAPPAQAEQRRWTGERDED